MARNGTRRRFSGGLDGVSASGWAYEAGKPRLEIWVQIRGGRRVSGLLLVFLGPLLFGAFDLPQIADTDNLLRFGFGFDEAGNRYGNHHRNQDDGQHDTEVTGD